MRALPTPPFVERRVRPIVCDGLTFQRVQRLSRFAIDVDAGGNVSVLLRVSCYHFHTNADGTAGAPANKLIPPYALDYTTDNAEAVDAATGEVVLLQGELKWEDWLQRIEDDPRALVLRGDGYGWQMHEVPTKSMADEMGVAMDAADAPPYSRFRDSDD